MRIRESAYTSLTNKQRLVAIFAAHSRKDEEEVNRLLETCSRKSYQGIDRDFIQLHDKLIAHSIEIQAVLSGCALNYQLALGLKLEPVLSHLQELVNTAAAWEALLIDLGIEPDLMAKAGYQAHPWVEYLLDTIKFLEPDREVVEGHLRSWRPYYSPDKQVENR